MTPHDSDRGRPIMQYVMELETKLREEKHKCREMEYKFAKAILVQPWGAFLFGVAVGIVIAFVIVWLGARL
jgi:hypothetical protein